MPDFLTPGLRAWPEAGADNAIRATPHQRVRTELAHLAAHHRLPAWGDRPARADHGLLGKVADSLAAYYDIAVGDHGQAIQAIAAEAPNSTTEDLARRLDISMASASEHATVLRQAGLTRSHRQHRTVRHRVRSERGLRWGGRPAAA